LKNRRSPAILLGFFISKSKVQRAKFKVQSKKIKDSIACGAFGSKHRA
jgi:hypothetical protein